MRAREEPWLITLAIRLGINAVALWVAAGLIDGFDIEGWESLLATAAIFGIVNAIFAPVLHFLGFPLTCLTLGLFALLINTVLLAVTVWIGDLFDLEVDLDGFWAAFFAALIVTVTSWFLSTFLGRPLRRAFR
jgi:putative membrane protein